MRHGPRRSALISAALLACVSMAAQHARAPLHVTDTQRLNCASGAELQARVEERLGRPLTASAVFAQVSRRRDATGWHAELRLLDARSARPLGVRSIHTRGKTCTELDASLVLVLTLMLDAAPASAPAKPSETRVGPPAPASDKAPATPLGSVSESRWRPHVGVVAGGGLGFLPKVAWGVGLAAGVEHPRWLIGADFLVWPHAQQADGETGSNYWALTGRPTVCLRLFPGEFWLAACAGVRGAWLSAEGFGFQKNQTTRHFLVNPGLGVRLGTSFGPRFAGWLELTVEAALRRPKFQVRNQAGVERELFAPAPVEALATAGMDFVAW